MHDSSFSTSQMIRQEADQQQQEGGAGAFIMACLANCIGAMVEKITKFTTIVMSISGQSFMDSAYTTYDLLTVWLVHRGMKSGRWSSSNTSIPMFMGGIVGVLCDLVVFFGKLALIGYDGKRCGRPI